MSGADVLRQVLLRYMDEETDGEFLRYYRLNPLALGPLVDDLIAALDGCVLLTREEAEEAVRVIRRGSIGLTPSEKQEEREALALLTPTKEDA